LHGIPVTGYKNGPRRAARFTFSYCFVGVLLKLDADTDHNINFTCNVAIIGVRISNRPGIPRLVVFTI
jgi:hypothetical protein